MVTVGTLLSILESIYPPTYAMRDDNIGLMIGNPTDKIRAVLVALDLDEGSIERAVRLDCGVIVTHHPIWRRGPTALRDTRAIERRVLAAARAGLSVLNAHTNADFAPNGLCALLGEKLGLIDGRALHLEHDVPIGAIGRLAKPAPWKRFVLGLKKTFGGKLRISGIPPQSVEIAAVCSGSGSDLMEKAFEAGADVFVTGDVKYHAARDAESLAARRVKLEKRGFAMIDAGHFETERFFVPLTAKQLARACPGLRIERFDAKTPFTTI